MSASALDQAISIWHQAYAHPIGVGIRTSDIQAARSLLYRARARLAPILPQLTGIALRTSPIAPATDLWLLRDPDAEREALATQPPADLTIDTLFEG